jgi:hypothetical protein
MSYLDANELIFNNDTKNGIHTGGFSVNSIMMKAGMSPIMTLNTQYGGGDKVSDLFNNLVIPNWSLSYNYKNGPVYEGGSNDSYNINKKKTNDGDEDEIMEETLHDKLLNLVKVDKTEMKEFLSNKKTSKKNFKPTIKSRKNATKKCNKNNKN